MAGHPQEFVEHALAVSQADGCVVVVSEHSETNLRWAADSLTTNGQSTSRSVTVIATFDGPDGTRAGVVTRSISALEEVDELVRAAELSGRSSAPAEDAMPLVECGEPDAGWADDVARTSVSAFEGFAPALAAQFRRDPDRLLFGFAEHAMTSTFVGSSTGLRRRFDQPDGRIELNGKSADLSRSAWAGRYAPDFAAHGLDGLVDSLDERLGWARTRVELPAGRYETVLPPTAVADVLIYAYWTASGRDAEEGRNVYARDGGGTRIGEQLSSLPLTLRSDPHAPGLECAPFEIATASSGGLQSVFDNGAPVDPATWIDRGRLTDLVRTRAWAQRTGAAPRPFVGNLLLEGEGDRTLEQMVAGTERGLLLTCLWYIREVDPQTLLLTGLTRDGVYLVEDGQVRGAVNNFRWNESPIDLLARATEAGRTEPTLSREWNDDFRRTAMPPLRIPDFNMSTVSKAS